MYGRNKQVNPKRIAILTTAAVSFAAFSFLGSPAAQAEGIKHVDQIRVALVINATKYKKVEPLVSLSSAGGFDISVRSAANAVTKLWTSSADTAIRMSLDQYSMLMLETSDFTAAKALNTKLAAMAEESYVLSRLKFGKPVYQVYYGSLPSLAEAESAGALALKDATVAALTKAAAPVASGPLHLTAGTFATETAAEQQISVFTQAGLVADLVLQADAAGTVGYQVWLGNEATDAKLEVVKQAALKVAPNLPFLPANTKSAYLIRRSDVTSAVAATAPITHYAMAVGEQKTLLQPKTQGVAVHENADRKYRGNMEVSSYHDRLALVNEVPTDQYLYSVLGSELSSAWPAEALKAQAVAARTYAIAQGNKYEIAQVTDTTLDQAYFGMDKEFSAGNLAVDATKDEVITDQRGGLISPVFGSNAGGQTADPSEVWGNPVTYLRSVASPDEGAEQGKAVWYQVQLNDGKIGYVHSMYLKDTAQKDKDGKAIYEATEQDVNVRLAPYVDNVGNPAIAKLAAKEKVAILGQDRESNAYSWVRGPFTMSEIKSKLQAAKVTISGDLTSLEISKRGPSGRVMELKANGVVVKLPYPDAIRSALGGLPSTLFEIEGAGSYTGTSTNTSSTAPNLAILSSSGVVSTSVAADSIYVLSGKQTAVTAVKKTDVMTISKSGVSKPQTSSGTISASSVGTSTAITGNQIIFRGKGNGHGLGMSQWGAKGFAEQGYDYKKILQTYFTGVNITKE